MCGIAGTINFDKNIATSIKETLYHRGPDKYNNIRHKNIELIHTRLSIQDIQNGHQPFQFKEFAIVFNGEIYNHLDIRKQYLKDFKFNTLSDTETLLYLYIKYKQNMFDMIDGMFAFCILDKKENRLILARDRAGKKPLYLYKKGDKLLFASELNTIKIGISSLDIDEDAIYSYLRNGFFYRTSTPYKDTIELQAGCIYDIDIGSLVVTKKSYFEMLNLYKKVVASNFEDTKEQLDKILNKSVKNRLLSSDLEVGAFLSGGIDSGLIVAIASKYIENLKTFTVKFDGAYDESHLAELTAKRYNTQHHTLNISINLKDDIKKIISSYGEPFMDSSAIPSYYISREAKKYVTVVLNGDGADELFGGYRRYVPIANNWIKLTSKLSSITNILPKPQDKKSIYNYIFRLLSMSGKRGLRFYNSATNDIFEDVYNFGDNSIFKDMDIFIKSIERENISPLSKILYLDFILILQNDLLKKMDISTMTNSLESRSPFLSKYMLEFAPKLTDSYKIKGLTTKFILRELSKTYLPKELINQPKRGFEIPLKNWVENDLKEQIYDTIDTNCYSCQYIDRKFIQQVLNGKTKIPKEKRAKILWDIYSLEIWKENI